MGEAQQSPRGRCPECDRDMRLNNDGTLRHHGGPEGSGLSGWRRAYRCKGAGQWPLKGRVIGGVWVSFDEVSRDDR